MLEAHVLFWDQRVSLTTMAKVRLLLRKASLLRKAEEVSWSDVSMTFKRVCVIKF